MWDGDERKMAAALIQMACLYRGMLAVRAVSGRPLIPGAVPLRLRAFSVQKKEREPQLEDNPFYGKYADKIKELRSCRPEEFRARMEKQEEVTREPLGVSTQAEFARVVEQEMEKQKKSAASSGGFTKNKTLASILNIDKVQDKSGKEIAELWMQYFATKDTVCAVIPGETFEVMFSRAKSCPTASDMWYNTHVMLGSEPQLPFSHVITRFLYALPRKEGYEFFLGQWAGQELHFTSLINIQTMGENAPSQLILYHYSDLQEDKGIVLMTAEMDSKFIGVHQAQCLANQVQLFYGTQRRETFALVETFNHRPSHFKHTAVIAELEQNGIGSGVSCAKT